MEIRKLISLVIGNEDLLEGLDNFVISQFKEQELTLNNSNRDPLSLGRRKFHYYVGDKERRFVEVYMGLAGMQNFYGLIGRGYVGVDFHLHLAHGLKRSRDAAFLSNLERVFPQYVGEIREGALHTYAPGKKARKLVEDLAPYVKEFLEK